ncbi:MAG: DUF2330 domain-containing protein [Myxococcales bacterium]|nr:DUF2330 domain-containing protein [Myxococcales bacterium]
MLASVMMMATAWADPCGMVPPIRVTGEQVGIERQGLQQTYVFFRNGVQTIAIHPGFTGSVEEFGMLVPLPAVPSLRKIDDRTFAHLAAAIDPPQVDVYHSYDEEESMDADMPMAESDDLSVVRKKDAVRVVKEEAVGMYQVAVLEAGSASALQRWMDAHQFRYPRGMDDVVADYVRIGWMFVAIKAKVGTMAGVEPAPGMRGVKPGMPEGASFDGYVQGMGFRFRVDAPVIPMRLSVFNGDDTHNRVYLVTEGAARIPEVSAGFVRRQIDGRTLHGNLTEPLVVRMEDGSDWQDLTGWARDEVERNRQSDPHVGVARSLIAGDLMAVASGSMTLPFEEQEKELLRINEALGLRGAGVDGLVMEHLSEQQAEAIGPALQDVYEMTLNVIDGSFPARVLGERNLTVSPWRMPEARNRFEIWNVRPAGPVVWL